jgi:hypothetical protein
MGRTQETGIYARWIALLPREIAELRFRIGGTIATCVTSAFLEEV